MTRRKAPSACLTFGDFNTVVDSDYMSSGSDDEQEPTRRPGNPKGSGRFFSWSSYFQPARSQKSVSGIDSLADLDLPDWSEQLHPRKVVSALPVKNFNEKERLRVQYEEQFYSWLFQLRQGFSLLFYGFGSKRHLLEKFARDTMQDGGVLSINGLALGLTARQVLHKAAGMLKRASMHHFRSMQDEAVLQEVRADGSGRCLYVVLHNIEGLSEPGSQMLLSELAACPNVHLVASMDNVNTPLLWDKQTGARFNWLWHDVTNYAPYIQEAVQIPSLLVGRSEEKAVSGGAMVLRTLVPKAREVFKILARHQLDAQPDDTGAVLSFPALYRECRDRFLVQNEVTLRAHLTEFKDHELVQTRRGADGGDVLLIPMDADALQQLLDEVDRM